MRKISADKVYTASFPSIQDGVVIIDDSGKILSLGHRNDFETAELEIYQGILCPGFINAHCHLELSYMKGKIQEWKGLVQFIMDVIDYRNELTQQPKEVFLEIIDDAIKKAEQEMLANGIVGVGDISNDDYTFPFKARSDIQYHTFVECYGFYSDKAEDYFQNSINVFRKAREHNLSASIIPHAPYSVPPELFRKIFSFRENHPPIFSMHNQEVAAENELFLNGTGDFQKFFQHFHLPPSLFHPTGKRSLESVINYFPADKRLLLVHNTQTNRSDFEKLQTSNLKPQTFFCTCPNANLYIENQLPDYSLWKEFSDRICIGTDSLSSNNQLSVLEEMKTIQQHFPTITTEELIQWSTINGAKFFGWENELGSLETGKHPGLNLITGIDASLSLRPSVSVTKLI